ncbi:hypothetical protein A3732_14710 [Oleiphilus sp. HI0050]|nr:hypothetical protein A3732_14710 [Oleiphilus sp. HI0050]
MKKLIIPLLLSWPVLVNADLVRVHFTAVAPANLPFMEHSDLQIIDGELVGSLTIDTALAPGFKKTSLGNIYYSPTADERWVSGFVDESSGGDTWERVLIWDGAIGAPLWDHFSVTESLKTQAYGRESYIELTVEAKGKPGVDFVQGTELTQDFTIDQNDMEINTANHTGWGADKGSVIMIKKYGSSTLGYTREPIDRDGIQLVLKTLTVETITGDSLPEVESCSL